MQKCHHDIHVQNIVDSTYDAAHRLHLPGQCGQVNPDLEEGWTFSTNSGNQNSSAQMNGSHFQGRKGAGIYVASVSQAMTRA